VVTQANIIAAVAGKLRLPTDRAEEIVCRVFDAMTSAFSRGEGVELRGFGSFTMRQYRAYRGLNPRTRNVVEVPAKRLPFVRPGKDLRERIRRSGAGSLEAAGSREPLLQPTK